MSIPTATNPETTPRAADDARRRALLDARSLALARRGRIEAEAATRSILLCTCGSERYGLPLAEVATVMTARACTAVPGAPDALLGLVAVSGRIVSVLGLAAALGRPAQDTSSDKTASTGHFVVLRGAGAAIALAVDRVEGVVRIAQEQALGSDGHGIDPSGLGRGAVSVYAAAGPEDDPIAIVDPRRLLGRYLP